MDVRLYGGIIYAIQINNTLKPPEDKTVNGYTLNINSTKALEIRMKIDNEFYSVVKAVLDSKMKTLHVVNAYINKNDTFPVVPNAKSPKRYAPNELQSNVPFLLYYNIFGAKYK